MTQKRRRREPDDWEDWDYPDLLAVTGFRDQKRRITYLPWSSARLGAVGWEVFPDREPTNLLIYIIPSVDDSGVIEIRCHMTMDKPDPTTDELLGTITIPPHLLGGTT